MGAAGSGTAGGSGTDSGSGGTAAGSINASAGSARGSSGVATAGATTSRDASMDSATSNGANPRDAASGTADSPDSQADAGSCPVPFLVYNGPAWATECSSDADCPSTGPTKCFMLTADRGVCDMPQPQGSGCSVVADAPDECGCEGGTCSAGRACSFLPQECACQVKGHNVCVPAACATPADCGPGMVCTPSSFIGGSGGRCMPRGCLSDADCNSEGNCGRCAAEFSFPIQAGPSRFAGVQCVYAEPPAGTDAAAPCHGTSPQGFSIAGIYACPAIDP